MIPMTESEFKTVMIFNVILAIIAVAMFIKYLKEAEGSDDE